jgi:YjbE family integral membrane protein
MEMSTEFWTALLQIIGINIVLSGDNAVVIALACRSLEPTQQRWGIFLGSSIAIVLRVVFTVFIVYLLTVPYLKIGGALLLLWIGYQLVAGTEQHGNVAAGGSLWHAVRIVLVADAVMSLDNVVAVAAAAKGNFVLLVVALVVSVPLVIYGATLLVKLLHRFPAIVPGGAALIGYVAGEIALTDPAWRDGIARQGDWLEIAVPPLTAILVVLAGRIVDPAPAKPSAANQGAVAGSALLAGVRAATQISGRLLLAQAPAIVGFFASVFGYAAATELTPDDVASTTAIDLLKAVRPIFAAVVAVVLGNIVAWGVRRVRT